MAQSACQTCCDWFISVQAVGWIFQWDEIANCHAWGDSDLWHVNCRLLKSPTYSLNAISYLPFVHFVEPLTVPWTFWGMFSLSRCSIAHWCVSSVTNDWLFSLHLPLRCRLGLCVTREVLLNSPPLWSTRQARFSWQICIWCIYRMTWLIRSKLHHICVFHILTINLYESQWRDRDRWMIWIFQDLDMYKVRCDQACSQTDICIMTVRWTAGLCLWTKLFAYIEKLNIWTHNGPKGLCIFIEIHMQFWLVDTSKSDIFWK